MEVYGVQYLSLHKQIISSNFLTETVDLLPEIKNVSVGSHATRLSEINFLYLTLFTNQRAGFEKITVRKNRNRSKTTQHKKVFRLVTHLTSKRIIHLLLKINTILLPLKDEALITNSNFSLGGEQYLEIRNCQMSPETYSEIAKVSTQINLFIGDIPIFRKLNINPSNITNQAVLLHVYFNS